MKKPSFKHEVMGNIISSEELTKVWIDRLKRLKTFENYYGGVLWNMHYMNECDVLIFFKENITGIEETLSVIVERNEKGAWVYEYKGNKIGFSGEQNLKEFLKKGWEQGMKIKTMIEFDKKRNRLK